jgi:hypothetical protein
MTSVLFFMYYPLDLSFSICLVPAQVHVALAQAHKSTDTTQRLHNLKIVEAILLEQVLNMHVT